MEIFLSGWRVISNSPQGAEAKASVWAIEFSACLLGLSGHRLFSTVS
jgi:hypothetical protein